MPKYNLLGYVWQFRCLAWERNIGVRLWLLRYSLAANSLAASRTRVGFNHCVDGCFEPREIIAHRLPHDFKIDVEIAVRHSVAHTAHLLLRELRVFVGKSGIQPGNMRSSFTQGQQIQNDCLLRTFVFEKGLLVHALGVSAGETYRFEHVR